MGIDAEMFVRTRAKVTEAEVKLAAYQMCAVFGVGKFFVRRDAGRHALGIVDEWTQDGPTLHPEPGETFIAVSLYTRFWGPGYERGDLALLVTLAEWLERRFPGGEVWYGGDSSGVCAEHMDRAFRERLLDHAASKKGAAYRTSSWFGTSKQMCGFCEQPMAGYRSGAGGEGYICLGCDLHRLVQRDGSFTEAVGHYPDEKRRVS